MVTARPGGVRPEDAHVLEDTAPPSLFPRMPKTDFPPAAVTAAEVSEAEVLVVTGRPAELRLNALVSRMRERFALPIRCTDSLRRAA